MYILMRVQIQVARIVILGVLLALAAPSRSAEETEAGCTGQGDTSRGSTARLYRAGTGAAGRRGANVGSIWSSEGRLVRLGTDAKAIRLHDVVSVVVSESLAASTDGQVKNSRASNASSSLSGLFGALKSANAMQHLVNANSASGLTAQGQSTTNSSLSTTFGAEVVDVLPNGMLVVQATRQLTFSQQTQLIKLRGLVRPEDVSAQNQVQSTAMTDLELEVTGKGIVNDSTYRQNPLVRMLERVLIF